DPPTTRGPGARPGPPRTHRSPGQRGAERANGQSRRNVDSSFRVVCFSRATGRVLRRHAGAEIPATHPSFSRKALNGDMNDTNSMPARSASASPMAIDVRDLHMRYGAKDVLRGVTFNAQRGEVLALLGPNGAGKTTTIEILEGFRMRSAGEVSVLGVDPARGDETWRARIGVVLQSWRDHGRWRVRELLDYLARFYAPFATPDVRRPWDVNELIDVVGLKEHANAKLMTLSGGQRRRLDVAIGIVGRPEVVFLDEPTAGF